MHPKTAQKLLSKVVEDYDNISTEFDQTRQTNWKEFEVFLPYIKENQFLGDLGCGNGRFYKFIKQHRQIKYLGIDNSEKLLAKAKLEFPETDNNKHQFIKGDLLNLPIADNSLNVAAAIASIHHIPGKELRQKAIQELHRVLKKNGLALITVWNLFQPRYKKYVWFSRLKSLLSFGKYNARDTFIPWGKTSIKRYYYAFTEAEISSLLKKSGFKIIKKETGNNITIIAQKI